MSTCVTKYTLTDVNAAGQAMCGADPQPDIYDVADSVDTVAGRHK